MPSPKASALRRVVTGHDANGSAKVLWDGAGGAVRTSPSGATSTLIWCTDATPAPIPVCEDVEDMGLRILGTPPPRNGTRFTVNEFPPGSSSPMHRTETIDYGVVIAGEIEMQTDDDTVTLHAGDVVVQRGTNHRWVNRGSVPARIAFVLIDAEPLGIGSPVGRNATVSVDKE